MSEQTTHQQIQKEISENDIVLYMKGDQRMPQCGFSGTVVHILNKLGVTFKDVNVLENEAIRQGIKEFTNWPTIPQLYIKGEFIGGCDIVKDMYQSKELQSLLKAKNIPFQE